MEKLVYDDNNLYDRKEKRKKKYKKNIFSCFS